MDSVKAVYGEIDWLALSKRLTAYALKISRSMPPIFDGVSGDDLVMETLAQYWGSETRLDWDPSRGSLERFLCGVLKNKFLEHARRHRASTRLADASQRPRVIPLKLVEPPARITVEQIREAARGDAELEELVDAIDRLENDTRTNQQLSLILGINISAVLNRKKRLRRRLDSPFKQKESRGIASD